MTILREKTESVPLKNFNYVLNHGDEGFSKKAETKPDEILWKNWVKEKHNIIIYWDKHHVSINETKDATIIWLPWMCWQWVYDKRLDLHSEPWFVVIETNEFWTPDITIKRLK